MSHPLTQRSTPIHGVHHTARPTWKLRETVEFYRDKLGLPLVHAISARGWPDGHPDFLHFFFDSGNGSTIAFFYYIGTQRPDYLEPVQSHFYTATHTAWQVEKLEDLEIWRQRLLAQGVPLRYETRHEIIESLYFTDPNGYPLEITFQLRPMQTIDAEDAERTIRAGMELEDLGNAGAFRCIDDVWRRKGAELSELTQEA
ncbi:VOC family protein [Hydrogenophaga sp. ZJX-1]|uniref:VOC family protein n=1 Tax=Hydrogenophaga sp. ZJX-1 TaxID=3404778 RepID=UPI003B285B1A